MTRSYVRALSESGKKSGAGVDEIPHHPYLMTMSFFKPYVNIETKICDSNFQPVAESLTMLQQTLSSPSKGAVSIPSGELTIDNVDDLFELPDHESPPSQTADSPPHEHNADVQNDTPKLPSKKSSYASMSQKQLDRASDIKSLSIYLRVVKVSPHKSIQLCLW